MVLISFSAIFCHAQTCNIISNGDVCIGNNISFLPNISFGNPLSYQWDFGDGSSSNNQNPLHVYIKTGVFQVTLNVDFGNNNSCQVLKNITVHALPKAKFLIDEKTKNLCFYKNNICIKDTSLPSKSSNPIIKKTFLWGDGAGQVIGDTNKNKQIGCHKYDFMGTFKLLLEIADDKGCLSKDSQNITILPDVKSEFEVRFSNNNKIDCKDVVCFFNTSKRDSLYFDKHFWLINGKTPNSNNYDSFCKLYDSLGVFKEKLVLQNKNGCSDTFSMDIKINPKPLDIDITIPDHICVGTKQTFQNKASKYPSNQIWVVSDSISKVGIVDTGTTVVYEFYNPGKFYIEYKLLKYGCEKFYYDSIEVWGPRARFDLYNGFQCSLNDSVVFCDFSDNGYKSYNVVRQYDFMHGDSCYIDLNTNKNFGSNCKYSNEISAKHWYDFQNPGMNVQCFSPSLTLTDTVTGCSSKWSGSVIIGKPKADDIKLSYVVKENCEDSTAKNHDRKYSFYLDIPVCINYWDGIIIYDSAKGLKSDILSGNIPAKFTYNNVVDPNGYVTIGIILFNGQKDFYKDCGEWDRSKEPCVDTIWFHNYIQVLPEPNSNFSLKENKFCVPQELEFIYDENIQHGLKTIYIDFGDGYTDSVILSPNDSILPRFKHTYTKPGEFRAYTLLRNQAICANSSVLDLKFGYLKQFYADSIACKGDSVSFKDSISYYNDTLFKWYDSARVSKKTEQVWWDFDDGLGFVTRGHYPKYQFKDTGIFEVKMLTQDSMGCLDTVSKLISILGLDVKIYIEKDTFVCDNNIVQFFDSSTFPSFFENDSIISRIWDFDGKKRFLQNPFYDYNSYGLKKISLSIKTLSGCESSGDKFVFIKGPTPKYSINSDSIGCAPFTVDFQNLSGKANNFIWYSGDENGITFNTDSFFNFKYTYKLPGTFYVKLIASDSIFNPLTGNMDYCIDSTDLQKIIVQRVPKADFDIPEKICKGEPFTVKSLADSLYTQHIYKIQNWDTIITQNRNHPYSIKKDGNFKFIYTPEYTISPPFKKCFDTAIKTITIDPITARFFVNELEPPYYNFNNTSLDAVRYKWDFGDYASKENFSEEFSPTHNYKNHKGTFLVCLIAYNSLDCPDTACAPLENWFEPRIFIPNVFTPGGTDTTNNRFDIDCFGELTYDLKIYNRWGELVFLSEIDGIGNSDKNNWDGTKFNNGIECPSGEYYIVFYYQLNGYEKMEYKGTATLIRGSR